jgi:gluconokinase
MIVVVMGVTGVGKTTVGRLLAARLGAAFLDADDFHPQANVEKMRAGTPLTDDDRWPWLARLNEALREHAARGDSVVLACSALKAAYRDVLLRDLPAARLVHLRGDRALVAERLAARRGHYMNPGLLDSQLATLEPPANAVEVEVGAAPGDVVASIAARLAAG